MNFIKTTERTFNNTVKTQLLNLLPTTVKIEKKHVASVGYVFFAKDSNNTILGKATKGSEGMVIYIN